MSLSSSHVGGEAIGGGSKASALLFTPIVPRFRYCLISCADPIPFILRYIGGDACPMGDRVVCLCAPKIDESFSMENADPQDGRPRSGRARFGG